nr:uncharacterized protein LOC126056266 [Helicoverpa armigera]
MSFDECKDFIKKRGVVKGKLTLFVKYVESLVDVELSESHKIALEDRCNNINTLLEQFSKIQDDIEFHLQDSELDLEKQLIERETFENVFYDITSKAKSMLKSKDSSDNNAIEVRNGPQTSSIKLPTITLPSFDGSFEQWLEFRDTYISLIHNSKTIDNIQKFHYLRSALTGSARQIIKSLQFTAENYSIAWSLLENRFNNNRLLVQNHVKALFSMQGLHKESAFHIRKLIDNVLKNIRALKGLDEPTDQWDTLLIFLIVSKMDSTTEKEWENHKSALSKLPNHENKKLTLNDMIIFLTDRADMLESIKGTHDSGRQTSDGSVKKPSSSNQSKYASSHSYFAARNNNNNSSKSVQKPNAQNDSKRYQRCNMCKENHSLYSCSKFNDLPLKDKLLFVDENKLCKNCLRAGHNVSHCWFGACKQCNRKHHSLLHDECCDNDSSCKSVVANDARAPAASTPSSESKATGSGHSTALHSTSTPTRQRVDNNPSFQEPVILSTALVEILDNDNKYHTIRAILDNGSQHSFITKTLCDKLKIRLIQSTVHVAGVGNSVTQSTQLCKVQLRSKNREFKMHLNCLVLPCITATLPSVDHNIANFMIPTNVSLADPEFYLANKIDLLIGADMFWELLNEGLIKLKNGPYLQNTKLGWVVSGAIHGTKGSSVKRVQCNFTHTYDNLDVQLTKFWELEEISSNKDTMSKEERDCEDLFIKTTTRDKNGRFSVRIPLRESADQLGDSYQQAESRFLALERKLGRCTPSYKKLYFDFMREYLELGHMTKIDTYPSPHYFLPHHGVFREHSTSTKLRVVFDASAKTTSGQSLNDIQLIGPPLQNDLFAILLRFRQYTYIACADVEKMYRQTLIQPDQQYLQLILWRENPLDALGVYRLNTVTYGTASAPFLSMRCLKQLGSDCADKTVANIIYQDFYVDDLITGFDDKKALLQVCDKVSTVLKSGCFVLRKWLFNFDLSSENTSKNLSLGESCQSKTLGLGWFANTDELHYTTKLSLTGSHVTKRIMLSAISQIYDPLGLLSPIIILAKILLQKLWTYKLGWDDPVPHDILINWKRIVDSLDYLSELRIPRQVINSKMQYIELHIFTDASQNAYGACAYVRMYSDDNNTKVSVGLLCAKSKVAPVKPVTIPRLELCGALLGAKLYTKIIKSLRLNFTNVYFWTDSTIVLGWLRMSPNTLKTFVQNRVVQINELTGSLKWLHVGSKSNPADLVSRGVTLDALRTTDIWWHGPPFLHERLCNFSYDHSCNNVNFNELPDIKSTTTLLVHQTNQNTFPFDRFSSFIRMKRIVSYMLRFIHNARNKLKCNRKYGPLQVDELNNSVIKLTQMSQKQSFSDLDIMLSKGQLPSKINRNISSLNLFLDNNKIIRVGGRLSNSASFLYDKKHPILLCSKHTFTRLLFEYEHKRLLHAGPQLLLASLRENWWPLRGRDLARNIVHKCVTCTRIAGKTVPVQMGNLPSERLEPGYPFMICGVDYAGPMFILNRKGRGAKLEKCYICLFVCFSTRAVHLELVTSLTTEAYMLALKRFISRRGKPSEIFSDNGKNFIGAMKEFTQFLKNNHNNITEILANDNIKFNFIPPYTPHFGGLWEAGVKSCKYHIRRVIGNANLTYEEFSTILAQIEAVLNSRPMHPLSADPTDLLPLSPSLFLIGRPLTAPATPDLTATASHRLSRYDRVEQMRQHFWRRWSTEYISELQTRTKWKTRREELAPNTLVLIKEDNLPPLKWRLGRILHTFPGKDGVSRVADIKTATGTVRRAFTRICPLLPQENDTSLEAGASKVGGIC